MTEPVAPGPKGPLDRMAQASLWQIVLIYAGGGYAVLEAIDLFSERFGLPSWTFTAAAVLLGVGLPVVVATAVLQRSRTTRESASGRRESTAAERIFTWRNALAGGVIAFALLGVANVVSTVAARVAPNEDLAWLHTEAIPEIERLSDAFEREAAFLLAQEAMERVRGDSALLALWDRVAVIDSIVTDPPGATVSRKGFGRPGDAWVVLGQTPLYDVRRPFRGGSHVRIELDGYDLHERVYRDYPESIALDPVGSVPDNTVVLPAGEFSIQTPGLDHLPAVALPEARLGRFEVTNREYKDFVDAGGYQRPELWETPFVLSGREVPFDEAVGRFVDQTGRPGPSTWEVGDYPDGRDDYPVSGVSWYEAMAYARYRGSSLPTVYDWVRAAGTTRSDLVVPNSNLGSEGPAEVGSHGGVTVSGAYDQAGNVREWCLNADGDKRYILGGGWDDLPYMFNDAFTQSPWDRSQTNGFRLAHYDDEEALELAAAEIPLEVRDFMAEEIADDQVFAVYRRMFEYDPAPLEAVVERADTTADWVREFVSMDAAYADERLTAYVYLPVGAEPPYQTVVFFPGSNAIHNRVSDDHSTSSFGFLVKSGRAVIFPVYKGTYERGGDLTSDYPDMSNAYREWLVAWVQDFSRTVDYAESRPDLDAGEVAYYGVSWGGYMGGIVPAVERRIGVVVLYVAGLAHQRSLPEADAIHYVPRITQPVLMLNGRYDHFFPLETSQIPMFELLGTPAEHKRHVVSEAGHYVPRPQLISETLDWLDRYLGPVGR